MFQRLEFEFKDSWFEGTKVSVYYDEHEDKTYCFYSCNIDSIYFKKKKSEEKELILDGHALVEELENCNFRNWYILESPFVCIILILHIMTVIKSLKVVLEEMLTLMNFLIS